MARVFSSLPDVARIELAWRKAYHAADEAFLTPEALGSIAPEELEATHFALHPSVSLIPSQFPATDLWSIGRELMAPDQLDQGRAQTTIVCRPDLEVIVESLNSTSAKLLNSMTSGKSFGIAVQSTLETDPNFDISAFISLTLRLGLLSKPLN